MHSVPELQSQVSSMIFLLEVQEMNNSNSTILHGQETHTRHPQPEIPSDRRTPADGEEESEDEWDDWEDNLDDE